MGGRVNCVLRLVGQPLIGTGGHVVEDVIKVGERLPAFDPTGPDQLGSDQVFEVGDSFGFPDLVSEADHVVIDGRIRCRPARMRASDKWREITSEPKRDQPV